MMDDYDEYDDDGFDGPGMGGGGGPPPPGMMGPPQGAYGQRPGTSAFGVAMLGRKALSVAAILAVLCLEAAVAIQDAQLRPLSGALEPKNHFRKRHLDTSYSPPGLPHAPYSFELPTEGVSYPHTGHLVGRAVDSSSSKESKSGSESGKNEKKKSTKTKPEKLETSCGYYVGFDVPAVSAGKGRAVFYHFANCVGLAGLLFLEKPGPHEAADMLGISKLALPPIGKVGLTVFSLLQMWFATSVLNHFIGTVSYIAAYFLLATGFIGLLFSIIFMGKLKSVAPLPPPPMMGGPPMGEEYY